MHASIHEGARAGRADFRISAHNDPQSVEDTIRDWRVQGGTGRVWIVAESLYSMDGDFAPVRELVALAERYEAFLIVDEAHATGVYGEQGRGLTAPYEGRENLLVVHTYGKALGAAGALVTATGVLRDFMVNRCRPFIFATAPSPLTAVAVREAILILGEEPERQQRLARLVAFTHREMASARPFEVFEFTNRSVHCRRQCARDAARIGDAGAGLRHSRNPAANRAGGHGTIANFTHA